MTFALASAFALDGLLYAHTTLFLPAAFLAYGAEKIRFASRAIRMSNEGSSGIET